MLKKLFGALVAVGLATAAFAQVYQIPQWLPGYQSIDGSVLNYLYNSVLNLTNYSLQKITAAQAAYTYTVPNNVGMVIWDIAQGVPSSSGNISQATVTTPANPFDGQRLKITSRVVITTFALVANTGQSLATSTPTVITPSTTAPQGYEWVYNQANTTWYRLQ